MEISFISEGEKVLDFKSETFLKDIFKRRNRKFYNFSIFALSFLDLEAISASAVEYTSTFKWLFGTGVRPVLLMILCVVALIATQFNTVHGDKDKSKSKTKARIGKVPKSKLTDALYLIISIGALVAWVVL